MSLTNVNVLNTKLANCALLMMASEPFRSCRLPRERAVSTGPAEAMYTSPVIVAYVDIVE